MSCYNNVLYCMPFVQYNIISYRYGCLAMSSQIIIQTNPLSFWNKHWQTVESLYKPWRFKVLWNHSWWNHRCYATLQYNYNYNYNSQTNHYYHYFCCCTILCDVLYVICYVLCAIYCAPYALYHILYNVRTNSCPNIWYHWR